MFGWLDVTSLAMEVLVAAFGRVVLEPPRSRSCSVWTRCRSVPEARKQQLQRPGAFHEACSGQEVAYRSVARACRGRCGRVSSGGK